MANTSPTSSAKPVASFRYGNVSAAIFTNEVKSKEGNTFDVHNVSVRRSYRDGKGDWAQTHTLRATDLLPAALALQECYRFLANDADTDRDDEE